MLILYIVFKCNLFLYIIYTFTSCYDYFEEKTMKYLSPCISIPPLMSLSYSINHTTTLAFLLNPRYTFLLYLVTWQYILQYRFLQDWEHNCAKQPKLNFTSKNSFGSLYGWYKYGVNLRYVNLESEERSYI